MCLGVVAILLLNIMDVFIVCGGALFDRPCMVHYVQLDMFAIVICLVLLMCTLTI